jgi:hypothetical protein
MPRKGFVDAYTAGRRYAIKKLKEQREAQGNGEQSPETVISLAMQENPYTGTSARVEFLAGVRSWISTQTTGEEREA